MCIGEHGAVSRCARVHVKAGEAHSIESVCILNMYPPPLCRTMPEGPEIRRAADRIRKAVVGDVAHDVFFAFDHLVARGAVLSGCVVEAVEPRGKAIITRFEGGLNVYSHNQLYGRWYIHPVDREAKTTRSLRFAITTETTVAALYSASDIFLLDDDGVDSHPYIAKLGPDPLADEADASAIAERAASDTFRRRGLPGLLLDQAFVAGLGNYLRSEILFSAGLRPTLRPTDLSDEQLLALGTSTVETLRLAYSQAGVTTPAEVHAAMKADGHPRKQWRHWVFNREGQPCHACGAVIERHELGGRRLYACPSCQS
ncbi:MAG: endonuclease-8 [Bradymonadia bacterium]|jgi:endonuclease-8